MTKESITQKHLKELLHYDPETGFFIWNKRGRGLSFGKRAGNKKRDGYVRIMLNRREYSAHRLAWLYIHGSFPKGQIDHINHVRADNRIKNLRDVTRSENQRNASFRKNNKSGFNGVFWYTCKSRWVARIYVKGKIKHLGNFIKKSDAIEARKKANIKYDFHENHGL